MNGTFNFTNLGPLDILYKGADSVLQATQGTLSVDVVSDFIDSVRWKEPFILGIMLGQVFIFALTLLTRQHETLQFCILAVVTAVSVFARAINELGREHWARFATQNYFDRRGFFMLIFISGPFIVLGNIIVLTMMRRVMRMMMRTNLKRQRASAAAQTSEGIKKSK